MKITCVSFKNYINHMPHLNKKRLIKSGLGRNTSYFGGWCRRSRVLCQPGKPRKTLSQKSLKRAGNVAQWWLLASHARGPGFNPQYYKDKQTNKRKLWLIPKFAEPVLSIRSSLTILSSKHLSGNVWYVKIEIITSNRMTNLSLDFMRPCLKIKQ